MKKYYEAYDKRYKQIHQKGLSWSPNTNTKLVLDIIKNYDLSKKSMLEIGCGEGRDARYLLSHKYNLLATDISKEAILYCQKKDPQNQDNYQVLNVIEDLINKKFDFIYSIACLHMFVLNNDRNRFYQFIYDHLEDEGYALILSMGDGIKEFQSDINKAFDNVTRIHQETNTELEISATSCRMVSFNTLFKELEINKFKVIEHGITIIDNHFDKIMYVLIKKDV